MQYIPGLYLYVYCMIYNNIWQNVILSNLVWYNIVNTLYMIATLNDTWLAFFEMLRISQHWSDWAFFLSNEYTNPLAQVWTLHSFMRR